MVTGERTSIRGGHRGFTLIEVMMVVVIVGILAFVALPSYQQHVLRGHRTAAQGQMMDIANREQQYLVANRIYADEDELNYTLPSEIAERYDMVLEVDNDGVPTFEITFEAKGAQESDGDLTLNSVGVKTPLEKW